MADGEGGAEISRFEVVFDAKTDKILDKLNGLQRATHGAAASMKKDLSEVNFEKALDKVFDSSRLTILDEGAARLRVFGSALEPLGPLGIAAAAGIAAMGFALEEAKKAAEWAEDLEKTAKTIGISTNALQEFDFVATASGIKTDEFRKSIEGLNEKIGEVQANVGNGRAKKVFDALGISAEQLRSLGTVSNILPVIADKLAALPDAERAGLAAKLDLSPILPALLKGKAGYEELIGKAHEYGVVIDADVIQRSAEAAEKLKIMDDVIDKNLKASFAELSPLVADLAGGLATAAKNMADFIREARDAVEPIARLLSTIGNAHYALLDTNTDILGIAHALNYLNGIAGGGAPGHGLFQQLAERGRNDKLIDGVNDLMKGGHRDSATIDAEMLDANGSGKPVHQLVPDKAKKGRNPEEVAKASQDAIAKAVDEELKAREALTKSAQARLDIELQLLRAETDQKVADLESEVALKKITRPAADRAETLIRAAAVEKESLLRREAAFELEDKEIDAYRSRVDATIAVLTNEAATAATAFQRNAIEKQILALKQQELRDLTGSGLDRQVSTGEITPQQRDSKMADLAKTQASDTAKQQYDQTYTAIHGALDAAVKGGWPGLAKYMADKLKENLVDALANALTNVVIGGGVNGGGGGIFSSLFGAIATTAGVPAFADGTSSAPGGVALVGERGPELVNLPRGAGVVPNNLLGTLGGVTKGMSISAPSFSFDLRGAVMTEDLVAQMQAIGAQAQRQATIDGATLGAQAGSRMAQTTLSRRSSLQFA